MSRKNPLLFPVSLLVVALLAAGCLSASTDGNAQADASAKATPAQVAGAEEAGHQRMVETLAALAKQSAIDNPYLGAGQMERARTDLAAMPEGEVPKRWFLNMYLGKNELRLGREEAAIEHYLEANRLLASSTTPVPDEMVNRTLFETSLAFMRRGETQNCVAHHSSESCIFPIEGGGRHRDTEPSLRAQDYLLELLKRTPPTDFGHLRARWLLNVVAMTLGTYPDGVPKQYLIPPDRFESDEPFPRFKERAAELGLATFSLAGGAIVEDFSGDGRLDVIVSSMHTSQPLHYHEQRDDGTFEDRSVAARLDGLLGGLNLVQADYDNDGDVDFLVLRGAWWRGAGRHPNSLVANNGDGTFTDVTFAAGLGKVHYPTQTANWADYDNDGDLDLYIGNEGGEAIRFDDSAEGDLDAPCQLFRNNGDGTFLDVAAEAGVENRRFAKGVVWGDYNEDRFPDLYVSNGGHPNRLYRNNRDGTFTDVAPELNVTEPMSSFPAFFWDVNNDSHLDLLASAYGGRNLDVSLVAADYLGLRQLNEADRLYIADGKGGFTDRAAEWGFTGVTLAMGANFGDIDNDGWLDFYLGTGYPFYEALMPNRMFRNRQGRGFADVTTAGGFGHLQKGHGVVIADLDDDGDQDVFGQIGGAFPGDGFGDAFFENPGSDNHWLKVSLVGKQSNRFGVGARIRVDILEADLPRSIYITVGSGGSFGANPLRSEIGLGQASRIERLEVYWPTSDLTQVFEKLPVDRWIEIEEGGTQREFSPRSPVVEE